jgi:RNA-directed DNA polymerase
MRYLEHASSAATLRDALDAVVRKRGAPGPDGVTVAEFAFRASDEVPRLQAELASGAYRPRPARLVQIPKPGGGHRRLAVGCVRDRLVQHSLATVLSVGLDDELHASAYAYRKGRKPKDAVLAVERALASGLTWVFRADVEEFFDRISHPLVLAALERATGEPELTDVVERLLNAGLLVGGGLADVGLGAPQGSPLSPFLANLYLVPFDQAMEKAGLRVVRYGDDLCVNAASRDEATRALGVAARALRSLNLSLNEKKTLIGHLGAGFVFLGFQFDAAGRRPSARSARSVVQRLEEILRERPRDGQEELELVLRGWVAYYGSFASVGLPEQVRALADGIWEERAQELQLREQIVVTPEPFAGPPAPPVPLSPQATGAKPPPATQHEEPAVSKREQAASPDAPSPPPGPAPPGAPLDLGERWCHAATELGAIAGAPDEEERRAALALTLGAAGQPEWPALANALGRRDGPAAAELLGGMGRFGDAVLVERLVQPVETEGQGAGLEPSPASAGHPHTPSEGTATAAPRPTLQPELEPEVGDLERLLSLFGGAEHAHVRERRVDGGVVRERMLSGVGVDELRRHVAGEYWLGVFPLRANGTVRFAAVRCVSAARARAGKETGSAVAAEVATAARALVRAAVSGGVTPLVTLEPGRGYLVWILFDEPIHADRAVALARRLVQRAGPVAEGVTRELIPVQVRVRPERPGTPVFLPLGLDPRTGDRAWPCDQELWPGHAPFRMIRELEPLGADVAHQALRSEPAPAPEQGPAVGPTPVLAPPFGELPRAKDVHEGCVVLRYLVDRAMQGQGLPSSERYLLTDVLGRLGDEAQPSLEAIARHLDDYRPGLVSRWLARMYPNPTSCGRIRQKWPELTARLGCDCRFRVPPGAYPTPVLHAVGASTVPGLADRVREAASKGGLARAALAAMNEGRKELGMRAAALCARVAELRRQATQVEKQIARAEEELDAIVGEAGEEPLQTPAGTLLRVHRDGKRRFMLEV